jgi:DNA polymerase-3 subunit alpha
MISLIKGGAFDSMIDRKICMAWFLWEVCDKKERLTLQNMPTLIKYGLLPENTNEQVMARRVYEFNRYLKAVCKGAAADTYQLDERAISFLTEIDQEKLIDANLAIGVKTWDKVYQKYMDVFRTWIAGSKEEILTKLNTAIFREEWMKYAKGTISAWEMEALCFYYHDHELKDINFGRYGISNFFNLPEDPVVDRSFVKGGKTINLFKLTKICGTCIAKDKAKSTATILTPEGVVNVKFSKQYFAMFDKQISEKNPDGTKSVKEKSWFNRGSMVLVQGMRSGDQFMAKKYASSGGHTLYRIDGIDEDGALILRHERYQGEMENE